MKMKQAIILAGLVMATAWNAPAGIYTFSGSGGSIPDNQPNSGLLSIINVTSASFAAEFGSNPYWVQNLASVQFTVTGGWNGDYRVVLTHVLADNTQLGSAVLLNRMGQDGGHPNGWANAGMTSITLDDTATTAINFHPGSSYTSGAGALATGTYAPQGGVTFNSFEAGTTTPLGIWALYFTDHSPGDTGTVPGWTLNLEVVPEPVNVALGCFAGVFLLVSLCRSQRVRKLLAH